MAPLGTARTKTNGRLKCGALRGWLLATRRRPNRNHKYNGELPMKRQRGRGRKPGGGGGNYHNNNQGGGGGGGHYHPNRSLDSNGPETKVRGTASHINERYLQLARDAASSGDRVLSENYLQHADHYFRLWRSMQPAVPVQQPQQNYNDSGDYEGEDERTQEAEGGEEAEMRGDGDEQPDAEHQGDRQREGGDRGDGDRGPRRGRNRRRFSPDGERQGGHEARDTESREPREGGESPRETREHRDREPRRDRPENSEPRRERTEGNEPRREHTEGGDPRPPRRERVEGEPREPRRERQPRDDAAGREGFSDGPKPAFLRGGSGE